MNTRVAQILCVLFILLLGGSGLNTVFNPTSISEPVGWNLTDDYAITNVRTVGAPLLSFAIITAIGALRKNWMLILPASLYFLFNATARIISVFAEGFEPVMMRGLILTSVMFVLSQVAINIFRRAE